MVEQAVNEELYLLRPAEQSVGEENPLVRIANDEDRLATIRAVLGSTDEFSKVILTHPNIALVLLKNLSNTVRQLTENVKTLALQDVYGRIRKTLLSLGGYIEIDKRHFKLLKKLPESY